MPDKPLFNYALLLLATLWGGSYTFMKIGVETIPPITLIAGRTLIAGMILVAIIHLRGLTMPRDRETWRRFLVQACLNSAIPFTMIAWAETHIDAGLAAILNATSPIFAFLITAFITRHEAVTLRKTLGVLFGIVGCALVIGLGALSGLGQSVLGQLAVVGASVLYGFAAVYAKNFKGLDPIMPAAGSLIAGAIILIPVSLVVDQPWTLAISQRSALALLGLAIFSTALAFVIFFFLLTRLGTVGTTAQAYLRLPIGVMIGVVVLGERLSSTALVGLIAILIGVVLMTLPQRPR